MITTSRIGPPFQGSLSWEDDFPGRYPGLGLDRAVGAQTQDNRVDVRSRRCAGFRRTGFSRNRRRSIVRKSLPFAACAPKARFNPSPGHRPGKTFPKGQKPCKGASILRGFFLLLFLLFLTSPALALDRITIASDGKSFTADGKSFIPWGFNYGNGGRLIEDFWDKEWPIIESDFREMGAMGGNVVRVHLQFGKFMEAADRPNPASLTKLRDLLALAEKTGLYLDLTGLACYRPADVPPWYDALDDKARWAAQSTFWRAIAEAGNDHPALFCYDLMNEPISPGDKKDKWYSGALLGGYDFIQMIARDPAGRPRNEVATAWIDHLTAAIREKDKTTMITVGMLPWVTGWQHLSGFLPAEVAKHVDFLSVHIYPKTKEPAEAPRALKECAVGKPVVIEETFPLECSVEELETFLRDSRSTASGWIWHYDGKPVAEYDTMEKSAPLPIDKTIWRSALRSFERLRPEFTAPASAPVAPPAR